MLFSHTSSLPQSTTSRRFRLAAAAGAALLIAGAATAWQVGRVREATPVTTVSRAPQAGVAPATGGGPVVRSAPERLLTLYLVSSPEQATAVLTAVTAGNDILVQLGQPEFVVEVVVAATADEEQALIAAHEEANNIRAAMGLAPLPLISLTDR